MSRTNLSASWGPEEHPPMAILRAYQTGQLTAAQRHRVEHHLLSCELCSDLLGGMALARPARVQKAVRETRGRLKNILAQKKRSRKVFRWPIWQTTAVLLVLAFAMGEVIYHHYFAKPRSHSSTQTQTTWQLTGQVVNAQEQPLLGATVQVKDFDVQALTDQRGEFNLNLTSHEVTLMVSYRGYQEQEVKASRSNNRIGIVLREKPLKEQE